MPELVEELRIRGKFIARYAVQTVGGSSHEEWWIPAENRESLNDNIVGLIEVTKMFE